MFSAPVSAAPLFFGPIEVKQPTGEVFIQYGAGDEYSGCYFDDHDIVVECGKDNFWYYDEMVMNSLVKYRAKCGIDPIPSTAITRSQYLTWLHQKPCVSFRVDGQIGESQINEINHTIIFYMPYGSTITAIQPKININSATHYTFGAVNANMRTPLDFTSPKSFTVTHSNNSNPTFTETWTATCVVLGTDSVAGVTGIMFTDLNQAAVTSLIPNTYLRIQALLNNDSTQNVPITMIVSLYDRNDIMKRISIVQKAINANSTNPCGTFIALPSDTNGYYVKVFVFDDFKHMMPYESPTRFPH